MKLYSFALYILIIFFGGIAGISYASPQYESDGNAASGFALVELFTSEGCSSCPRADDVVTRLQQEAKQNDSPIYTIAWHVDYWDYLGWKDRFAHPDYTLRQRRYAAKLPSRVYTPQMVLNGQEIIRPAQRFALADRAARATIQNSATTTIDIDSTVDGDLLTVEYSIDSVPRDAMLALVVVESGIKNAILRGENAGRTLLHTNAARAVEWVSPQQSGTVTIALPDDLNRANADIIAFAQAQSNWHIVAATGKPLLAND